MNAFVPSLPVSDGFDEGNGPWWSSDLDRVDIWSDRDDRVRRLRIDRGDLDLQFAFGDVGTLAAIRAPTVDLARRVRETVTVDVRPFETGGGQVAQLRAAMTADDDIVAVDVLTPAEQKEREERLQASGAEVPIDTFTTHLVGTLGAQADPGAVVDRYKLHAVAALAWPEWHFEVARG